MDNPDDDIERIRQRFEAIKTALVGESAKALYRGANIIMTEAKQLAPVDTGVLRASGYVQEPVIDGYSVSVTLGFGGAAEAYALVQHEDLTLKHTVGEAKFLERPALAHRSEVIADVAEAQRAVLRKQG